MKTMSPENHVLIDNTANQLLDILSDSVLGWTIHDEFLISPNDADHLSSFRKHCGKCHEEKRMTATTEAAHMLNTRNRIQSRKPAALREYAYPVR